MMHFTSLIRILKRVLCSLFSFVAIITFILLVPISETIHNESIDSIQKLCEKYVKSLNCTQEEKSMRAIDIHNESIEFIDKFYDEQIPLTYTKEERTMKAIIYTFSIMGILLLILFLYWLCRTHNIEIIRRFIQNFCINIRNIYWLPNLRTIIRNIDRLFCGIINLCCIRTYPAELAVSRENQQVLYRHDRVYLSQHTLPGANPLSRRHEHALLGLSEK